MSICNRLDLQTLGYQPIMPKNLPGHWLGEEWVDFRAHSVQIRVFPSPTGYML